MSVIGGPVTETLRVAVATPLPASLRSLIVDHEPRIELLVDDLLLPPMRFPADFRGDPAFKRSAGEEQRFIDMLESADALYGIPDVSPALLKRIADGSTRLRWVHTMAAGGGSQVRAAELTQEQLRRITFTTSSGVHAAPLAEFALLGLLAGAKGLRRLEALQEAHNWPSERWAMGQLAGSRVLVAGMGAIGRQVTRVLQPLGVEVVGLVRTRQSPGRSIRTVTRDELPEAIADVHAVVCCLPGTPSTCGLFSEEIWAKARPGITVVNVGRGTAFDEPALIRALEDGTIGFAALDVVSSEPLDPASPLWDMKNVLISPHTAALDPDEERRIAELFADNAARLLDGRPLRNRVDTEEFY